MYDFKFADIGEGVHEGVIHEWLVSVGDQVKDGDTLFAVETDKVTAEIPSPVDGIISKINFQVGDTIHVGDVAVVIDNGNGASAAPAEKASPVEADARPKTAAVDSHTEQVTEEGSTSVVGEIEVSSDVIASSTEGRDVVAADQTVARKALATPVARKMAKDFGLDINQIAGTGPGGRVMKADIQHAHDDRAGRVEPVVTKPLDTTVATAVEDNVERVQMSQIRKTIAKNMVKSKFTIPHTAAMDECDVTALAAYRKKLNQKLAARGIKLSYLPFVIKAVAIALREHPIVNASLDEERDEILLKGDINIGIATDTEAGLTVPVIRAANQLSLIELGQWLVEKAEAARSQTLSLADLTGGTFTITNYGSIGTKFGFPVIKHPEAAILGLGTIYKKPSVAADGGIEVIDSLPLSMSFDHRIVDGADAGRFINTLKELLSDPDLLVVS